MQRRSNSQTWIKHSELSCLCKRFWFICWYLCIGLHSITGANVILLHSWGWKTHLSARYNLLSHFPCPFLWSVSALEPPPFDDQLRNTYLGTCFPVIVSDTPFTGNMWHFLSLVCTVRLWQAPHGTSMAQEEGHRWTTPTWTDPCPSLLFIPSSCPFPTSAPRLSATPLGVTLGWDQAPIRYLLPTSTGNGGSFITSLLKMQLLFGRGSMMDPSLAVLPFLAGSQKGLQGPCQPWTCHRRLVWCLSCGIHRNRSSPCYWSATAQYKNVLGSRALLEPQLLLVLLTPKDRALLITLFLSSSSFLLRSQCTFVMLCRSLQTPVLALIFLLASQLGSDKLSCHAELPLCSDIFLLSDTIFPNILPWNWSWA